MQFPLDFVPPQPSSTAQQQNSGQPQAPSLTPVLHSQSPVHHIHHQSATSISSPQHLSPKHSTEPLVLTNPLADCSFPLGGFVRRSNEPPSTSYHSPVTVSPMTHHHSYMELFMV